MKKIFLLGIVCSVLVSTAQAITISNEPAVPENLGLFWGEDTSIGSVSVGGQTFVLPNTIETRLTDFSFWVKDRLGDGSFFYDFVVAEWDQSVLKPIVEVFRQKQRWDTAGNGAWNEVGISGESIGLDASKTYIALLDGTPYRAESIYLDTNLMNMRVLAISGGGNPIDGGVYSGSFGTNPSLVIDSATYYAGAAAGYDLAYSATFVDPKAIPDSGTSLVFLGVSLSALVLVSRRLARS